MTIEEEQMTETAIKADDRLETLSKDVADLNLMEFWKLRGEIEPLEPKKPPYLFGGNGVTLSRG